MNTTTLPVNVNGIPGELRQRRQWVLWKTILRKDEKAKVPYQVWGTEAKANDQATWDSFEAIEQASSSGKWDGIGYVFAADDPYVGIDLDGCLDPESGAIAPWAQPVIGKLSTYCEVSPSGSGVKLWIRGKSPFATGKNKKLEEESMGGKSAGIEIYDHGRFFCMTGQCLSGTPASIERRDIAWLKEQFWPEPKQACHEGNGHANNNGSQSDVIARARKYADAVDPSVSGERGHDTTFRLACQLVNGFDLGIDGARPILYEYSQRCSPPWTEQELEHKLESASKEPGPRGYRLNGQRPTQSGEQEQKQETKKPSLAIVSVSSMLRDYPHLREAVIHGIAREGETVNIIAASKVGKSWLSYSLAFSVALGLRWLGFPCEQGRVLIIDNELHKETISHRLSTVANALGVSEAWTEQIDVLALRGQSVDIHGLARSLASVEGGHYKLIIADAFYRFIPAGTSENDNAQIMAMYNRIDGMAANLGSVWVNIHHSSKGDQSGKTVTDVGSGAGSQSRAADAHLVLRPHEDDACAVLEGAVRSFAPVDPRVLRWEFPLWTIDEGADPKRLLRPASKQDERRQLQDEQDLQMIREHLAVSGRATCRKLRDIVGTTPVRIGRLMAKLVGAGQVTEHEIRVRGHDTTEYDLVPSFG